MNTYAFRTNPQRFVKQCGEDWRYIFRPVSPQRRLHAKTRLYACVHGMAEIAPEKNPEHSRIPDSAGTTTPKQFAYTWGRFMLFYNQRKGLTLKNN